MNEKEIGEIRRRIRRDRSNMTSIYGCYVNAEKEIISEFRQGVGLMAENDAEKYFSVMKRTLSGTLGKNLIDITFKTSQVQNSPEHKLLMDLRETALKDDETRMALYRKIIDSFTFDDSYVILMGCDSYDVLSPESRPSSLRTPKWSKSIMPEIITLMKSAPASLWACTS